jgi:hypothetical protein
MCAKPSPAGSRKNVAAAAATNRSALQINVLEPRTLSNSAALAITPVNWKHKKTGLEGTFKALNREWLYGVPDRFLASKEERLALYNEIVTHVGGPAVAANDALFRKKLRELQPQIPINYLEHPVKFGFGREIVVDPGHVGCIVVNFDDNKSNGSMMLIWRSFDDFGNVVDAHFVLYDGWHSSRVRIEQDYSDCPEDLWTGKRFIHIPVTNLKPVACVEEAAAAFASVNGTKERKSTSSRDTWRHRVLQNDPAALAVVALAADAGLDATCAPGARGFPNLGPATVIEKLIYKTSAITAFDYVEKTDVCRALNLLSDAKNIGLVKKFIDAKKSEFIGGLTLFTTFIERPGFAHAIGVAYMFSRPDCINRIKQIRKGLSRAAVLKELAPFMPADALQEREETMRYLSIAAALLRYYKEFVAAPKSRNQLWDDCPIECKRLMHEALIIADPVTRGRFIAEQQKILNKIKGAAKTYCPAKQTLGKLFTR